MAADNCETSQNNIVQSVGYGSVLVLLPEEVGIDCVLLAGGHQSRARLEGCGVPVVDSLGEIQFSA